MGNSGTGPGIPLQQCIQPHDHAGPDVFHPVGRPHCMGATQQGLLRKIRQGLGIQDFCHPRAQARSDAIDRNLILNRPVDQAARPCHL